MYSVGVGIDSRMLQLECSVGFLKQKRLQLKHTWQLVFFYTGTDLQQQAGHSGVAKLWMVVEALQVGVMPEQHSESPETQLMI